MTTITKSSSPLGESFASAPLEPVSVLAADGLAPPVWRRRDDFLLAYLLLPVPVFLAGFCSPWLGYPAAVLALAAFLASRPWRDPAPAARGDAMIGVLLLLALAALWTSLGGAGHTVYANRIDWVPRYGVLRDLVVSDWPPRYLDLDGRELMLRAPLGYYLVPALLGKLAGIAAADRILWCWTWFGVALFFLANFGGTPARRALIVLLFAAASGLDIVGIYWKGTSPWLGSHIEWWTGRMKYSSNSTMLYWIPNHVIPGWILGAWLWRMENSPDLLKRLPLIGLAVMSWSPLVIVGALPMIAVLVWSVRGALSAKLRVLALALLPVIVPALTIAGYLLMSAGRIRSWAVVPPAVAGVDDGSAWLLDSLVFIVVEVLVFGVFAWSCRRSAGLLAGLLLLCALPFFSFGPTNDLATLGAIPALTIIWLTLIRELTAPAGSRQLSRPRRGLLIVLLAVGAVTPFQESYRALTWKHWDADPSMPAPVALEGFPAHYFAPTDHWLMPIFRKTTPLPAAEMDWSKAGRR